VSIYYNELNPTAALWLQASMDAGHIPHGVIDTRSIEDVRPDELFGFTQCHFFAGIGGWAIALRLAGWPDNRPVWSGSCPCQPFSTAGKGLGRNDERHLWPAWFWLIQQCRPDTIFGEQVSNAITKGWWDDVATDLEAEGYTCGAAVLPACSVGKPHKRDRLWFVADPSSGRLSKSREREIQQPRRAEIVRASDVGYIQHNGQSAATQSGSDGQAVQHNAQGQNGASESEGAGIAGDVANAFQSRLEGHAGNDSAAEGWEKPYGSIAESNSLQWLTCPDGKQGPVKSGIRLLVDGLPGRLRKAALHGYGNAIVPYLAAEFIEGWKETQ